MNAKTEVYIISAVLLFLAAVNHYMMNTPTNVLTENGVMGHWNGYVGLYEISTWGIPPLVVALIWRLTDRLKVSGMVESKWGRRAIGFGIFLYFWWFALALVLLLLLALVGDGAPI